MPRSAISSIYVDASAIVKLVVAEAESKELAAFVREYDTPDRFSCELARVEVVRAVRGMGIASAHRARGVLEGIRLIRLSQDLLDQAAELQSPLRTLDAIHLAAAMTLRDRLAFVVSYDRRLARASLEAGLPVAAPGS